MTPVKRIATVISAAMMVMSLVLMVGCEKKEIDIRQPITLPLEKTAQLTWYFPWDTTNLSDYEDLNDHPFMQEMQTKTNIEIVFTYPSMPAFGGANTEYEAYLASEEFFDLATHNIYFPSHSGTTIDGIIDDGIYIDLSDLVDIHMPNFKSFLTTYPVLERQVYTQQGNIIYIPKITSKSPSDIKQVTSGIAIRQDMLDEYQLEAPTTISEWYNVLKTLKVSGGVDYPVQLGHWGGPWSGSAFFTAYGVSNTFQFDEEGNIVYGPMLDGTKDYLEEMAKWYAEGLIGYGDSFDTLEYKQSDEMAAFTTGADEFETLMTTGTNPNYKLTAVQNPTLEKGDVIKFLGSNTGSCSTFGSEVMWSVCISAACERPDYALKYLDQFYTEEMYYRSSYGIEGEDYTKNDDGTITFTDKIKNSPDGMRWAIAHAGFLDSWYYDSQVFVKYAYSQAVADAIVEWSKGTSEYSIPSDSTDLTAEESEQMAISVDDYASTLWGLKDFVTGERSITEWDSYVAEFYEKGVQEECAIYQAAYERWLAS